MWALVNRFFDLIGAKIEKRRGEDRRREQIGRLRETIVQVFDDITRTAPYRDVNGHWVNRVSEERAARFDHFLMRLGVMLEHGVPDLSYRARTDIELALAMARDSHSSWVTENDEQNRWKYGHLYGIFDGVKWLDLPKMPSWKWRAWPKDARQRVVQRRLLRTVGRETPHDD